MLSVDKSSEKVNKTASLKLATGALDLSGVFYNQVLQIFSNNFKYLSFSTIRSQEETFRTNNR